MTEIVIVVGVGILMMAVAVLAILDGLAKVRRYLESQGP